MVFELLSFAGPGFWEWLVIIIMSLFTFVLPVALIVWAIRSLVRNKRENQRLRLEVGKLADELEQLRKKHGEKDDGSTTINNNQ